MALDPLYIVTQDITSYFVNKDSGLPLAGGVITFYQDLARTVLQPVFTLTGAPPYNEDSYVQLPNPLILSNVGTYEDADSNPVIIYYYPYDPVTGDLSLYYIVVTDSGGNEQFTVEAWPNSAIGSNSQEQPPNANSYLVGWDFPLNPYQFGVSGTIYPQGTATLSQSYIADQTISQSYISSIGWGQDTLTGTNGISMTATSGPNAFYLLQYLSGETVRKMVGTSMSVNINGYVVGAALPVTMQIYLFRAPSTASIPTLPTTVGTISSNGTFSLTAAGWDAIPRGNLPVPNVTMSSVLVPTDVNNVSNNYGFEGYQITNSIDLANTSLFAMVVTFAYQSATTTITINSISLVPGDTPSLPNLLTPDDTLLQCQYYYQKSFVGSVVPAQNSGLLGSSIGALGTVNGIPGSTPAIGPTINFPVPTRIVPTITLYNPQATNAQIRAFAASLDWSSSTAYNVSQEGFYAAGIPPNNATYAGSTGCAVQWSAEARLGVV